MAEPRYRVVLVSGAAYVACPDGQPPRHFPTIGAAVKFKVLMERLEREALEAGGAP